MMKNVSVFVATLMIGAVILFGINMIAASQSASSSGSTQSEVQFQVSPALKSKATSPMPGTTAQQKSKRGSIGEDEAVVTIRDSSGDYWVEEIDLDGKGNTTSTEMLWDNTGKVLYSYADKTLMCKNGGSADADLLIAVYAAGNTAKKPAGSGWWMADLDAGECGMKTDAMYGCKFNQSGNNTACGLADLDEKTNELTIIEAAGIR